MPEPDGGETQQATPTKPMGLLGYLGRLFLTYLLGFGFLILVYLVPLIWGGKQALQEVIDIPFLNVYSGILAIILIPVLAVFMAFYTAVVFIPHGLVLMVWMGFRQRGSVIRTPIADMLVSGALMYGIAFLLLDASNGVSAWGWYGLLSAASIGGVIGFFSFRLSRARQEGLGLVVEGGREDP